MATQYHPAMVDKEQLTELQSLEEDFGKVLVAMEPDSRNYARLTPEQVTQLQSFEKKLGMVVVAHEN